MLEGVVEARLVAVVGVEPGAGQALAEAAAVALDGDPGAVELSGGEGSGVNGAKLVERET